MRWEWAVADCSSVSLRWLPTGLKCEKDDSEKNACGRRGLQRGATRMRPSQIGRRSTFSALKRAPRPRRPSPTCRSPRSPKRCAHQFSCKMMFMEESLFMVSFVAVQIPESPFASSAPVYRKGKGTERALLSGQGSSYRQGVFRSH